MSQGAGPRVHVVAAIAANGVIGTAGGMPWKLPEDLRHFKSLTLGHPIIMGRKTWETLGRPLPGRDNIVITRSASYRAPGARVATSLEAALAMCEGKPVAFVIGGGEVYAAALPIAHALVLTEIDREYAGDARFPDFDRSAWREIERRSQIGADGLRFDFVRYERA